jgi:hypothetical protein
MSMMSSLRAAACAAACALAVPAPVEAAFTFTVQQNGPDVEVDGNGALQLGGLSPVGSNSNTVATVEAQFGSLANLNGGFDIYEGFAGPISFGTGGGALATILGGDVIGIYAIGNDLFVPAGYVSGTQLATSFTFENQTLATLGLTPGTYVYSWGGQTFGDTLTIEILAPTGVPEPATALLLGAGLLGLGAVRRRR